MTRALRVRVLIESIISRKTAAATCRQVEETNDARATTILDNATNLTYAIADGTANPVNTSAIYSYSSAEDDTISETIAYSETGFADAVDPEPPAAAEEDPDEIGDVQDGEPSVAPGPSAGGALRRSSRLLVLTLRSGWNSSRRRCSPSTARDAPSPQVRRASFRRKPGPRRNKRAPLKKKPGRQKREAAINLAECVLGQFEFITKDEEAKGFGKTRGTVRDTSEPYHQDLSGGIAFCGASGYHPRVG
ncbi:uncharacterized protein LOC119104897 [Pollicipes pollicipes]|uniref:uncharacterized protein LOC119104897 n=1 Tax=Pollicipes pollicipes TaxID=41117 RepID=UPI001884ABC5|nr:uncharacterized protein LOC119104897 [Pollicipes pollicipes]XP_037084539.1 uncharacterized protein LOC119104897 [Pollicipes pollicipes]XP_037084547.1 uncharacterized protein LOC119104897 [Pollicipes pollicipes]